MRCNYTYSSFGDTTDRSGTTQNVYQFAGEQLDENLEQYYLRQRYYDAETGRFVRRDSYEGNLNTPLTLHKYVYGNANPVNCIDPSGYLSLIQVSAIFVVANILWQFINPFDFYGLDIGSDTIFPKIDPTGGLGGRINFNANYDFVLEDIFYRAANQIPRGRNVAVVQFRDISGKLRLRAAENITMAEAGVDIHSEQMIIQEIMGLGIPRQNIMRIYSEFEPCNYGGNNCAGFLRNTFPNAKVYWSYPYNDRSIREYTRQQKYLDLERYGVSYK